MVNGDRNNHEENAMQTQAREAIEPTLTLVVGGTGKTGRRVAEGLVARGLPVRVVARSTDIG